jgi:peroxisomal membrane protein 2
MYPSSLFLTNPSLARSLHFIGVLGFLQEVLANHIAGVPVYAPKDAPTPRRVLAAGKIDIRAVKIAAYGFFISAPMGHVLVGVLQKAFAGKTSSRAKIGQLLANNLIIAPIQTFGTC